MQKAMLTSAQKKDQDLLKEALKWVSSANESTIRQWGMLGTSFVRLPAWDLWSLGASPHQTTTGGSGRLGGSQRGSRCETYGIKNLAMMRLPNVYRRE